MTDWQTRVASKLNANREAAAGKPVQCACGKTVRFPCVSVRRNRPDLAQCFECWMKTQVVTGQDKWWLKPEFNGNRR